VRQHSPFDSVGNSEFDAATEPVLQWWLAILLLVFTGFLGLIAGAVLTFFISMRWIALIIEVFVYFVPVVLLIRFSRLRGSRLFALDRRISVRLGVLILAAAAAYSVSTSALVELAHSIWPIPKSLLNAIVELVYADSIPEFAAVVVTIAVIPAVAEELLFRGVVQPALIRRVGPTLGILLTAFLFAIYHLNPWIFLPLFIVGTFFGFLAYKTGTFWAGALAHFGNNFLAIVELNRAESVDYATLTEGAPWYILAGALLAAIAGTVVLRNLTAAGRREEAEESTRGTTSSC
jgi:membrane protease YdiL (CAAX protease family)